MKPSQGNFAREHGRISIAAENSLVRIFGVIQTHNQRILCGASNVFRCTAGGSAVQLRLVANMYAHFVVKVREGRIKVLHGLAVGRIVQVRYDVREQCVLHAAEGMPRDAVRCGGSVGSWEKCTRMQQG
jgi:hypothetical protein